MQHMEPRFSRGRCFISPILGCNGHCLYCYLAINGYVRPSKNEYGIDRTIEFITGHPAFVGGKGGTIISVGAWGDLFPPDASLRKYSIEWVKKLLTLGNPVQIMSKNTIRNQEIDEIALAIIYANQLLYSTTIITFDYANVIETGVADPTSRLMVLSEFKKRGIPTNIMIKPFIPHITDSESFINHIEALTPSFCVVGKLYWDDRILNNILKNQLLKSILEDTIFDDYGQIGCVGDNMLHTYRDLLVDEFIAELMSRGIRVFRKSSCINANILNFRNRNREKYLSGGNCMKCGNCM